MQKRKISFKISLIVASSVVVLGVGAALLWTQIRSDKDWRTEINCKEYAGNSYLPVTPLSFREFADWSSAVVVGEVLNPEAYDTDLSNKQIVPKIKIKKVLKGPSNLRAGKTIELCPNVGDVTFVDDNHTVLTFLDGYNGAYWVPQSGFVGIIAQNDSHQFSPDWASEGMEAATVEELQKLIK